MTIYTYLPILFSMYQISSSYIQIFLIIWICHLTFLFCVLFFFYNILWSSIVCYLLWDIWTLTIFILFYFIFLILLFFSFIFLWKTMKKAHDKKVTWQVTWCDIISLKPDGRVWKMMSGHLEYTWWPWVRSEASMRLKHEHKSRVIY